eukprot:837621-Pleurochrysis_carterae.AAC.1
MSQRQAAATARPVRTAAVAESAQGRARRTLARHVACGAPGMRTFGGGRNRNFPKVCRHKSGSKYLGIGRGSATNETLTPPTHAQRFLHA